MQELCSETASLPPVKSPLETRALENIFAHSEWLFAMVYLAEKEKHNSSKKNPEIRDVESMWSLLSFLLLQATTSKEHCV